MHGIVLKVNTDDLNAPRLLLKVENSKIFKNEKEELLIFLPIVRKFKLDTQYLIVTAKPIYDALVAEIYFYNLTVCFSKCFHAIK